MKRCLFVSSPPIRAQHRSNSNLSKAPPPCSKFHVRKLELFPVFGKHEYFIKFLKIKTILICLRPPPLGGGGLGQKFEKRKEKSLQYFEILDLCWLSLLSSYHASRLRRSNKPNLSQDNDISHLCEVYNILRFWIYVDCLCSPQITRRVFDAPPNLTYPKIMISHTYCDSIDLCEVSALS